MTDILTTIRDLGGWSEFSRHYHRMLMPMYAPDCCVDGCDSAVEYYNVNTGQTWCGYHWRAVAGPERFHLSRRLYSGVIFTQSTGWDERSDCPICDSLDSYAAVVGYTTCQNCGEFIEIDNAHLVEDEYYCEDCVYTCDDCGDMVLSVTEVSDGDCVCDSCLERDYFQCERCHEWDRDTSDWCEVDGDTWCLSCAENYAHYCDICDTWSRDGCDCGDDDGDITIHRYGYEPYYVMHGNDKRKFGVEAEIMIRSDVGGWFKKHHHDQDKFYCCEDGSLTGAGKGVEVISMPGDFSAWHSDKDFPRLYFDALTDAKHNYKGRAQRDSHCGLHVHVTRSSIKESQLAKFAYLWYTLNDRLMPVIRRDYTNYCKSGMYKSAKGAARRNGDRYEAINVTHKTVEIRQFQGTMNPVHILGAIELIDCLLHYCATVRTYDIMTNYELDVTMRGAGDDYSVAYRYSLSNSNWKGFTAYAKKYGRRYPNMCNLLHIEYDASTKDEPVICAESD